MIERRFTRVEICKMFGVPERLVSVAKSFDKMMAATRIQPRQMGKSIRHRFETKYGELLARNVYRGELIDERRELERKWQAEGCWNARPARARHLRKLRRYYQRVALWGLV